MADSLVMSGEVEVISRVARLEVPVGTTFWVVTPRSFCSVAGVPNCGKLPQMVDNEAGTCHFRSLHFPILPMAHSHPKSASSFPWRHWTGLNEVWVRGDLSGALLLTLRWLAVIGQGVTVAVAGQMGVMIPWLPVGAALGLTLVSNMALKWWTGETGRWLGGGFFHIALWDALILTWLLYWTGGLGNPFALFFLLQLTLAVVALRSTAAVALGLLMAAACGALGLAHHPLKMQNGMAVPEMLLMQGRFMALVLAGGFIITMLLAVRRRSHRLQKERERLRTELEGQDRFLSVAALATGFAHELATPLGSIALAAGEWQAMGTSGADFLVKETQRCLTVLGKLRELGQEAVGQAADPCEVERVLPEVLSALPPGQRGQVSVKNQAAGVRLVCPGLAEALLVMLRNALGASVDPAPVHLRIERSGGELRFTVRDRGPGFSPEMLRHWGEPFRSTRSEGTGMGLGLFFVRRLAASRQGRVEVVNLPGGGASVILTLPVYSG